MDSKKIVLAALALCSMFALPACVAEPDTDLDADDGSGEVEASSDALSGSAWNAAATKNGMRTHAWSASLASLAAQKNQACHFSHSCDTTASVIWEGGGTNIPSAAMSGWRNSSGHFQIIQDAKYKTMGCAIGDSGNAQMPKLARCLFK